MDYTLFSVSKGDGIPYSIEQTQKPDYNCLNWPVIDRCMEGGGNEKTAQPEKFVSVDTVGHTWLVILV